MTAVPPVATVPHRPGHRWPGRSLHTAAGSQRANEPMECVSVPTRTTTLAFVLATVLLSLPAAALAQSPATVPGMAERDAAAVLQVAGFRVTQVGEHPDRGITPAQMQVLLDAHYAAIAAGAVRVPMDFAQLQAAADQVTAAYRRAGFLVSTAYLPAQQLGDDGIVEVRVLEGRIGKVVVQGNRRYRSATLSDTAGRLRGQPLRKADIDSALLYARDLPGVSVSSILQPGEHEGETDLVLVASESGRPYEVSASVDNYGTELNGRGRAQLGLRWNSPLGLGDVFAANALYSFDPSTSRGGALSYSVPLGSVRGLSALAGASLSELEINQGSLAGLDLKGPASQQYAGMDWKFVNRENLQVTSSARYIREASRIELAGFLMSKQKYDVAEAGIGLRHTDARWHGVNLAQLSVRGALRDRSGIDLLNPQRDSRFTIARLGLLRLQYLSRTQRLLFKFNGQYSDQSLPSMEQLQLGGNDSVRGYPQGQTLGDRGYYTALEYHVDAPGFADAPSPFNGVPWREVLSVDLFVDHGRVFDARPVRPAPPQTLDAAGAGVTLRLPRLGNMELRLAAAVPTSATPPNDDDDLRVYARLGMTF